MKEDDILRSIKDNFERVTPKRKTVEDKTFSRNGSTSLPWIKECIKGEAGKPLAILANALIGLRNVWPNADFSHY